MSHTLELPEPLYAALQAAAEASGTTPTGWIAARLGETAPGSAQEEAPAPPQTLADLFAGRTGRIASGGGECLSEKTGEKFAEHLQAKKEAGNL